MEELRQKVKFFESRLGISKAVNLSIGTFSSSLVARLWENTIRVPPWFLFRYDDIPDCFHIAEFDDPRLVDDNFLNQFAIWMNGKINEAGLTSFCRPVDFGILQKAMRFLSERDLCERGRDFLLGHEMAHLAYSLAEDKAEFIQNFAGFTWGIFILTLAVSQLPFFDVKLSLTTAGVAIVVSSVAFGAWLNRRMSFSLSDIQEEKNADLASVEALQDATGGIYYFSASRFHNQQVWHSEPSLRAKYDKQGNNLSDENHPPLTVRIAYLKAWHSQHLQKA